MNVCLILALSATLLAPPDSMFGDIRGHVRAEGTGDPVAGVAVEMIGGGARRTARTDVNGAYLLRRVPAGRVMVRVRQLGYDPLQVGVLVPADGILELDLSIRLRPVALVGLEVRGAYGEQGDDAPLGGRGDVDQLRRVALEAPPGIVEIGLGEGYRGPPGQAPVDPADVLYVRGAAERKLVLLDGAPVYTPFHLAGLLEPFESATLRSASLYVGGAPARYDGGLSYVLDLSTRPGRSGRIRTTGSADLLSARLTSEGGGGDRLRYHVAARAIHGWGVRALMADGLPYDYVDGLARIDLSIGGGVLSATGFGNREGVQLDPAGGAGMRAGWANRAGSIRYTGPIGRSEAAITLARSGFEADLPTASDEHPAIHGETDRVRATADFTLEAGDLRLGYGASFDRSSLTYRTRMRRLTTGVTPFWSAARGDAAGGYLEIGWKPDPRLRLRGGLRGDLFGATGEVRAAPRISLSWLLSDRAAVTGSVGRYHQYVRGSEFAEMIEQGDASLSPAGHGPAPLLIVGSATHTTLSLHQEMDHGLRLGVEGFYKSFEQATDIASRSQASGVDLWLRGDQGPVRGHAGYSLSWAWAASGAAAAERFAGWHLVNGGLTASILGGVEVEARFSYASGLPFTSLPLRPEDGVALPTDRRPASAGVESATDTAPLPSPPDDSHFRLDIGVARAFAPRGADHPSRITPYLRVLNALDQRQGPFYRTGPADPSPARPVASLPLIPLAGVEWRF